MHVLNKATFEMSKKFTDWLLCYLIESENLQEFAFYNHQFPHDYKEKEQEKIKKRIWKLNFRDNAMNAIFCMLHTHSEHSDYGFVE